ncbi:LigD_N domain-containing protein [Trichoderma simmonsii]|uniref:LigD_N domain-containing protein n=1 Tax=Trichoderma simmonsii TaxID=1491479 RepID=A0A8G0PFD6_9HYPO|nr:LigD_N domain-containing protein [Trichoderma simmonsii]
MQQSRKRPPSPDLVPNPLIKKRNLTWSIDSPSSHPHPHRTASPSISTAPIPSGRPTAGTTAEIESGAVEIPDHLARFSSTLSSHLRPTSAGIPRLSVPSYSHLYQSCQGSPRGAHFVVHQHDHPVAGPHYDLRLQINETSSNHLVETASPETGSLLIWDTGTYSILPRPSKHAPTLDPSSPPASHQSQSASPSPSQTAQSLLHAAFQDRKIRLRLHGAKLPDPYVINLRLTKSEDAAGRSRGLKRRAAGTTRRRRGRTTRVQPQERETSSSSSSSSSGEADDDDGHDLDNEKPIDKPQTETTDDPSLKEQQDAQVRLTNAYHGASNTIGSIHQRRWYLSLDRRACGFTEKRRRGRSSIWEPPSTEESPSTSEPGTSRLSYPFYVRGPQFEQSVVTGRRGEDVLRDEGVTTFIPRKGWMPVMK